MTATSTVIVTLVIYQVVLLGLGWWARTNSTSSDGYFIGDRGLGPWVAALSYAAGSSSAWSILGVSGIAFSQGLSAFWIVPGTLIGHIVVWFWIAPYLQKQSHRHNWVTLTDMLNYSPSGSASHASNQSTSLDSKRLTAILSSVVIVFCFTFYIAAQFQGAASTFTATFGFDFIASLILGVVIVVAYTLTGGFWAVSLTDAMQAILMAIAAVLLPCVAVLAVVDIGGWSLISESAGSHDPFWSFSAPQGGWFGLGFFLGMLSIGFGPIGQPHLLNRIMAMRSEAEIRLARRIALTWFVIVLGGMFVLGVCGHVLLSADIDGESVFFVLAESLLPAVLTGVLIAAVLSAIMSTADSQLLVAGAAIQHDLIGRRVNNSPGSGGGGVGIARFAVLAVALLATALALYLPESIFSRVLFAWNALGAAFGPIVIVRVLGWQVRAWAVPLALILGFGLTVLFYSLPNGPGDLWERAVGFVTGFVTLLLARTSYR